MSVYRRTHLSAFALANNAYTNATLTFFEYNPTTGLVTDTKAAIYDAQTGGNQVSNPYTLDSEGKTLTPLYFSTPLVIEVEAGGAASHVTGVMVPRTGDFRGDWAMATVYLPGQLVRDGANSNDTGNLYVVVTEFTSSAFASDVANGDLELAADIASAVTSAATATSQATIATTKAAEADADAASAAASALLAQAASGTVPALLGNQGLPLVVNNAETALEYPAFTAAGTVLWNGTDLVVAPTYSTAGDPTANHDSADTAGIGVTFAQYSLWINSSSSEVFRCISATATAAVWETTTLTTDDLGTMAVQNANAVTITGGTITNVPINIPSAQRNSGIQSNGDHVIGYFDYDCTITEGAAVCASGTCTEDWYLSPDETSAGGTAITGGSFNVSSSRDNNAFTANNTVSAASPRYLVVASSSGSSANNVTHTITISKNTDD